MDIEKHKRLYFSNYYKDDKDDKDLKLKIVNIKDIWLNLFFRDNFSNEVLRLISDNLSFNIVWYRLYLEFGNKNTPLFSELNFSNFHLVDIINIHI